MLKWRGAEIQARIEAATRRGIDETMGKAVQVAKTKVRVDTGTLQGSIQFRPAQVEGNRIVGRWGSFDVNYALWQEIGTERMSAQPYLRPAADAAYPGLPAAIRKQMKR